MNEQINTDIRISPSSANRLSGHCLCWPPPCSSPKTEPITRTEKVHPGLEMEDHQGQSTCPLAVTGTGGYGSTSLLSNRHLTFWAPTSFLSSVLIQNVPRLSEVYPLSASFSNPTMVAKHNICHLDLSPLLAQQLPWTTTHSWAPQAGQPSPFSIPLLFPPPFLPWSSIHPSRLCPGHVF